LLVKLTFFKLSPGGKRGRGVEEDPHLNFAQRGMSYMLERGERDRERAGGERERERERGDAADRLQTFVFFEII
jgi:hypothetical protein